MKALICPQCGGKITNYQLGASFTTCSYCSTRFLIDENKETSQPTIPEYKPLEVSPITPLMIGISAIGLLSVVIVIVAIAVGTRTTQPKTTTPITLGSTPRTPDARVSPTPTPDPNILTFGGKGTGDGLFQDAGSIAVDKEGRIYVSDDTMRVQQFDASGKFLKVWQVPTKTENYKGARTIDKIAVSDDGTLYVAVGGAILLYDQNSTEHKHIIHAAPDYTRDFAIRSDGTLLLVVDKEDTDQLIMVNKKLKVLKRIDGFVSDTSEASLSPRSTGISSIRIAVDGAGNIFAIYAFGDLGSYQLSYNTEELLIFRFAPDGKYINKFVQTMDSCGIATDNQSRIYISTRDAVNVYTNMGETVGSVNGLNSINAFTLDKENNIYAILDDQIVKRSPIQ